MNAITTILVGIDGSPGTRAATGWAAGLAAACGAGVHAVYAWSSAQSELSPSIAAGERHEAEAQLDEWCDPLRRAGVSYEAEAVDGESGGILRKEAERTGAGLVVIGQRAQHGRFAGGIGAVAHELVHGLHMPVVVVPPAIETFPAGPVVVGVDESDANVVTQLWAVRLAGELGRALIAVHGLGRVETFGRDGWPQPDVTGIEAHLEQVEDQPGSIPLELVSEGAPAALDEVAEARDAAAVVVGGLRRGLLAEVRLGHTPAELVRHGSRPVVIVPDRP